MNKVAVVMGSKSDLPVVEKAINVLKDYHIQTEVRVLSAHRMRQENSPPRHGRAVFL